MLEPYAIIRQLSILSCIFLALRVCNWWPWSSVVSIPGFVMAFEVLTGEQKPRSLVKPMLRLSVYHYSVCQPAIKLVKVQNERTEVGSVISQHEK